jgi:hypothetical protein
MVRVFDMQGSVSVSCAIWQYLNVSAI